MVHHVELLPDAEPVRGRELVELEERGEGRSALDGDARRRVARTHLHQAHPLAAASVEEAPHVQLAELSRELVVDVGDLACRKRAQLLYGGYGKLHVVRLVRLLEPEEEHGRGVRAVPLGAGRKRRRFHYWLRRFGSVDSGGCGVCGSSGLGRWRRRLRGLVVARGEESAHARNDEQCDRRQDDGGDEPSRALGLFVVRVREVLDAELSPCDHVARITSLRAPRA